MRNKISGLFGLDMITHIYTWCLLFSAFWLGGCGGGYASLTPQERVDTLLQKYEPLAQGWRQKQAFLTTLYQSGQDTLAPIDTTPRPRLHLAYQDGEAYGYSFNTGILTTERLIDPNAPQPIYTTYGEFPYHRALTFISNKGTDFSAQGTENWHIDGIAEQLRHAAALRYVILVRVLAFRPPVVMNEYNYENGYARLNIVVIDLEQQQILSHFAYTAVSSSSVSVKYKGSDSDDKRLQRFKGAVQKNLEKAMTEPLNKQLDKIYEESGFSPSFTIQQL